MLRRLFKPSPFKLALLIGFAFAAVHFVHRAARPRVFPFPEIELLESKAQDIKFMRRGPVQSSGQVVIAGVDEASIQRYGLWPWKREVVSRALLNLEKAGALAVGVDMVFADPDRNAAHLEINRLVDGIVAAAGEPEGKGEASDPAQAASSPGAEPRPAGLKEPASLERGTLQQIVALAQASRAPDPDRIFAERLAQAPRAVIGVMQERGADEGGALPADATSLDPFLIPEVYDAEGKVAGPDGKMVSDWGPVFRIGPGDIRRIASLERIQPPLPVIAQAVQQVGLIDALQDEDGVIRHYALVRRVGDKFVPSLALATAAVALEAGIAPFASQVQPDGLDGVGLANGEPGSGLRLLVPIEPFSGRYLIDYPGGWKDQVGGKPLYGTVSLADAADGTFDPALVRDKVVLVGATAPGTFDQRVTPFDSFVPGVYTHAAVVDNILTRRFFVQTAGLALVEIALLLALAIVFGLVVPRFRIWLQIAFMLVVGGLYVAADFFLFKHGVVVASVMPLAEMGTLCFGLIFFNLVTVDREKRQIRNAFQYYLTKSVMEEMLRHPEKLKLGGDKRELTVLFSDIRGFTTISERLPPEELVRTLNEYLTPMTDLVFKHQGTLDKYMGDAIMAIWGAPLPQEDHALKACETAVEMLAALQELRRKWREQGRPDINVGIGLNSGPMAVGNMGSARRFDYTVMGDNVNLGSRLEGTNKEYGTNIIISEFTYALVKDKVVARELGSVRVKGKKRPVVIYELRGMGSPTPEEARAIEGFGRGLAAYRERRWDEAEAAFKEVCALWPEDGPSEHYLEDVAHKRESPPPEGWDGVYEMKTK